MFVHKKMKQLRKVLAISLFSAVLFSCTKYEDGPLMTFRSKTKRLCKTWKYHSIIYTDQGITVTTNLPSLTMTFETDGNYIENTGYNGSWKFTGDVGLEIVKNVNGKDSTIVWEITRLANKELWLRYNKVDHHFVAK